MKLNNDIYLKKYKITISKNFQKFTKTFLSFANSGGLIFVYDTNTHTSFSLRIQEFCSLHFYTLINITFYDYNTSYKYILYIYL